MPRRYRDEEATNPYARRMAILAIVFSTQDKVRTSDLAARFRIGANLLSYDLHQLEQMGLVERGYGWVRRRIAALDDLFKGSEFAARMARAKDAKDRIARYIAEKLIQPGNQVALDAGTTAYLVGWNLVELGKDVTVWTNNLPLFLYVMVHSNMVCHLVGGMASRAHAALVGEVPARQLAEAKFDLAVVTPKGLLIQDIEIAQQGPFSREIAEVAHGISEAVCLTLFNEDQAQHGYKRMLVRNANRVAVAVDEEKLAAIGQPFLVIVNPLAIAQAGGAVRTRGAMFPRGHLRTPAVPTEELSKLLAHPQDSVCAAAARAIGSLGLDVMPHLVSLLSDPSVEVQRAIAGVLAQLGEVQALTWPVETRPLGEVTVITDAPLEVIENRNPDVDPARLRAWAIHGLVVAEKLL